MLGWITVVAAYLALMGWMVAVYQWHRAEDYREMYEEERERRNKIMLRSAAAGAGAELMNRLLGGGKGDGGGSS